MKSEMENNVRGEMKEMKERLDTLTASLEENKDEGQFSILIARKITVSDEQVCKLLLCNLANLNVILIQRLVGPIFLCRDLSRSLLRRKK